MKHILIIEDDELLNGGICYHLQAENYMVTPIFNLKDALELIHNHSYDLILLDINLPDGNGFDFCKEIRKNFTAPIIMLTARDLEEDIMEGLSIGADDYITKPFHIGIFKKRIEAVLRRYDSTNVSAIWQQGCLTIDFDKMMVRVNGNVIDLTTTEYKLLKLLVDHNKMILTKQVLLTNLWDNHNNYVDEHTLAVNMNRLRSKIELGTEKYIKTIYGIGYMWMETDNND